MIWKVSGSSIASFHYQIGLAGNRTNLNETVNGTSRSIRWGFDSLYRLKNEAFSGSTSGTLTYGFDPVGNRTNRTVTGSLGLTNQAFSFNANDWLASEEYDANGNTTNSSGNSYRYDALNQLTNANNGNVVMWYDGDGNCVKKALTTTTNFYLIDSLNPSGYPQVIEEWTGNGAATNLSAVYNYGYQLILERRPSSSTNYFVFDGHGNTRVLSGVAGDLVNTFLFDSYGDLLESNAVPQTAYLYSGERLDPEHGGYYLRARVLNPSTGRYLTSDNVDGNRERPQSLHRYAFCEDDPVSHTDPSGHEIESTMEILSISLILAEVTSRAPVVAAQSKIALSTTEPALMLERLLIAETKGVEEKGFAKDESLKGIRAMGAAVSHRVRAKDLGFTGLRYPTTLLEVVRQKGQFAGFENYDPKSPKGGLSGKMLDRIDTFVQGANYPKDKVNYPNYVAVLLEVKTTAKNVISGSVVDPFAPNFTFGWRTTGHGSPGGDFKALGSAGGNTFFGLSKPNPPAKK